MKFTVYFTLSSQFRFPPTWLQAVA